MNMEERIARINALYHKSQTEGLNEAEKEEQKRLRLEYVQSIRNSLKAQLDNIDIQNEDGSITNLGNRHGKAEIRERILSIRRTMTDEESMEKSAVILKKLLKTDAFLRAWKVGLYASMEHEVITYPLISKSLQLDKGVSFPRITDRKAKQMIFQYVQKMNDLMPGTHGILEPSGNATVMEQPDVIIVPVVAFDKELNRIGSGGGYYDRYLQSHPEAVKIGIAYEFQKSEKIDALPTDVKCDMIITEEHIYD